MKTPLILFSITIGFISTILANLDSTENLEPREAFPISLAKLSLSFLDNSNQIEHVRITFDDSRDQVLISNLDDTFIKVTRHGTEKTVYRETFDKAFYLNDFEAKQIHRVCKTFISTLEDFEKDLKNQNWGKCLYLDSFLPKFLRGFYYLMCASRNSPDALAKSSRIPNSEFDVSLNSPKSDARIKYWKATPYHIVKLRIATKELIYQTKSWQKRELLNNKRTPEISYSGSFDEAFGLFVRIYFNTPPIPIPEIQSPCGT